MSSPGLNQISPDSAASKPQPPAWPSLQPCRPAHKCMQACEAARYSWLISQGLAAALAYHCAGTLPDFLAQFVSCSIARIPQLLLKSRIPGKGKVSKRPHEDCLVKRAMEAFRAQHPIEQQEGPDLDWPSLVKSTLLLRPFCVKLRLFVLSIQATPSIDQAKLQVSDYQNLDQKTKTWAARCPRVATRTACPAS